MSNNSYLSLQNIEKSFGATPVLADINLSVEEGEFVVLLGPSGCGKTTLLRIIAGLIQAENGSLVLEGHDLSKKPTHSREIGFVFQRYALFPHMTVRDNVIYGLKIRKNKKPIISRKLKSILELVELDGLEDRKISELSGGQQQRVALARALVIEPKLLLLDEPLSNLDAKLRASVRMSIVEIQKKLGITTIMVTHDQIEAMTMGDRIVLMNEGRIQQSGPPKELYSEPKDLFVSEFLGSPKINTVDIHCDGTRFAFDSSTDQSHVDYGRMARLFHANPEKPLREGSYKLGIRPECIIFSEEDAFTGTVKFTENCGADTYLYISFYGSILSMRVGSKDNDVKAGDSVSIDFLPGSLYLFNEEGVRLA